MVNLLLCLAVEGGLSSRVIENIRKAAGVDELYMVVGKSEELPIFETYGECILRENAARGIYDERQLNPEDNIPLEDDIIQYMNQYSMEIMHQQRRFELYPDFQIESDWNNHYTVYMHNLFFWYNYLKQKYITHVFISAIPHEGYDCIIYYLCKYLNISVQLVHSCFIPYRRYPLNDFKVDEPTLKAEYGRLLKQYEHTNIEEIPLEGKTAEVFRRWSSLQPDQMKPWYMRVDPFIRRLRQRFYETNLIRIWKGILGEAYAEHGVSPAFFKISIQKTPQLLRMIPIAWRRWRFVRPVKKLSVKFREYYQSLAVEPVQGEQYIYFPLQYQPEATSNPMGGGMYADQTIPLNILSKSLPADMKIYVKTHPEQLSLMRTQDYYDEIARIPKVRLMKIETSTYELMKNAVAVASLTGTALWECQFFGVPALAFGYSVKNLAPLTYHVRTVEECKEALRKIALMPRKDVIKELKIYTKALHNVSFEVQDMEKGLTRVITEFIGKDRASAFDERTDNEKENGR